MSSRPERFPIEKEILVEKKSLFSIKSRLINLLLLREAILSNDQADFFAAATKDSSHTSASRR